MQARAFPILILTIVLWGYNWVPMKIGLEYSSPMAQTALRLIGATLVLFAMLVLTRNSLAPPRDKTFILLGIFQTAGNMGFSTLALAYGDISRASILVFTMPLWTMIFAHFFLSEQIGARRWIAGGIAAAGMAIVVADAAASQRALLGAALAIGGGMSWAIGVVIARRFLSTGQNVLSTVAWQQLVGCIPIVIAALIMPEQPIMWTSTFIAVLIFSAAIGSGVAWYLWGLAVSAIPAATVGLATLAIPVVASLSAFLQLGERPDLRQLIGFALIIGALAFSMIGSARQHAAPQAVRA